MQDKWQRGYPTPKAMEHWEFRGLHLCNNSVFLVRLEICSTTPLSRVEGYGRGDLKSGQKSHSSHMPHPSRGSQGLVASAGCASPAAGGYGNHHHPVLLQLQRQRGTAAGVAALGAPSAALCHSHWFRQTNSGRESPLCWLMAVERSKNLSDFPS